MKYLLILISTITTLHIMAQDKTPIRTIEVTGTYEMTVDPEWIIFSINIEEYWKEEFEGKKYEEFKTKIDIDSIEKSLIAELLKMDVKMKQITLNNAGNYWRSRGKDFLVNKNIDIKLKDFNHANRLSNELMTRGIKSMTISKLDHSNMEALTLSAKKEALKAAKLKAEMMASVYGKTLGEALSIVEIDPYAGIINTPPAGQFRAKSMAMESAPSVEYENFRKIVVKEHMRVLFEIH